MDDRGTILTYNGRGDLCIRVKNGQDGGGGKYGALFLGVPISTRYQARKGCYLPGVLTKREAFQNKTTPSTCYLMR